MGFELHFSEDENPPETARQECHHEHHHGSGNGHLVIHDIEKGDDASIQVYVIDEKANDEEAESVAYSAGIHFLHHG
jgi:hypothetical protein